MANPSPFPIVLLRRLAGVALGAALRMAAAVPVLVAFRACGLPSGAVLPVAAWLCAAWAAQRTLRSFLSPDVQGELALLWLGRHLDHRDPVFGVLRGVMEALADPARAARALDRAEASVSARARPGRLHAVLAECRRVHGARAEARVRVFLFSQVFASARLRGFLERPEFRLRGCAGLDEAGGRILDAVLDEG